METERILLRPWLDSDAETLFKYASDPDVGPRAGWPPHKSVEESLEVIRNVFNKDTTTWAIVLKETGEVIGAMGYGASCDCKMPTREGEPIVGYWVAKPYWNKGYCTEALRLMLDYIRTTTDIRSLLCGHFVDNPASGRVMEKCGFVPTGEVCYDETQYMGEGRPIRVLRLELKLKMKHEIIELHDVQIIGMAKKIAFNEAKEECPKFWGEYVEKIIKPVVFEKQAPNAFQKAAFDNGVGEFGLCTCDIPNHNCATCWEANFGACGKNTFTYVIGGIYKGGELPEGMQLFPIHSGRWLKMHFEGGMKAFQEQYEKFHKEWLPAHPEYKWTPNSCCMEWYQGTDIQSPDYQCGVMMPIN